MKRRKKEAIAEEQKTEGYVNKQILNSSVTPCTVGRAFSVPHSPVVTSLRNAKKENWAKNELAFG